MSCGGNMPNYAIASNTKLEIGKKYSGLAKDPWGRDKADQPFMVMAECTTEKYVETLVSFGENSDAVWFNCVYASYFYEVSVD